MATPEQRRLDNYRAVADTLGEVAGFMGVELDAESVQNYRLGMEFMALRDDVHDDLPEEVESFEERWRSSYISSQPAGADSVSALTPALETALQLRSRITLEQAQAFNAAGEAVVKYAPLYSKTRNPFRFANLTLREGEAAADMLEALVVPETKEQPGYRRYATVARHIAAAGDIVDGIADLERDYEAGQVLIKPTNANKAAIGSVLLVPTAKIIHGLGYNGTLHVIQTSPYAYPSWKRIIQVLRTDQ